MTRSFHSAQSDELNIILSCITPLHAVPLCVSIYKIEISNYNIFILSQKFKNALDTK